MFLNKAMSSAGVNRAVITGVVASLLVAFSGAVSAESLAEFESNRNYKKAVIYMNMGYAEIGKVVNKLEDDKGKSALRHFNYATEDFKLAIEDFAKATLPDQDKAALSALKKGLDALQDSTMAMEKGDSAAAQIYYNTAQNYFAEASALLD